jgi:hypothetical protein
MRRPRLRQSKPDASVPPEVITEEANLRLTILAALPELRLSGLRALLRAVRYAEEGADVIVLRLSDLQDEHRRRLVLSIYAQSPDTSASASESSHGGRK